jgi:tRNA(Arg) A34 adenosine deaminase TadA
MDDLHFLKHAIQLARENSADGSGGPFGAVVVRDGELVGTGRNRVVENVDPTGHAEILAIRDAANRLRTHILRDCVIYCSCEPCPMCLAAIYWARIPRVVFASGGEEARKAGFDDTVIAREMTLSWKDRSLESRQALQEEGRGVLEAWSRNPLRREY